MYIYIYIYIHIYTFTYIYLYMHVYIYVYMQVREMVAEITRPDAESVDYDEFVQLMTVKMATRDSKHEIMKVYVCVYIHQYVCT